MPDSTASGSKLRRALIGLCLAVALLGACDGDDGESAAEADSTTTTTVAAAATSSSTTAPAAGAGPCTNFPESSPAQFDAKAGKYAVYVTKLDVGKRLLGFDVIQFLGGEAAAQAYQKETGETGGPPNDYYIVNESEAVREATASSSVAIVVVGDDPAEQRTLTLAELPAHLAKSAPSEAGPQLSTYPYWLTVADGTITEICQQYVP
ncbi:MAG TPA: hypothetical protein VFS16_07260 [Acidimicrobiia bacterium]|nr:hypothetical protein [Acidimicrobiia bacterium]